MRGKGSVQAFSGGPVSYQPLTTQRTNRSDPWVLREGPGAACQWRCRQRRVDQVHSRDQRGRHPEHAGAGWVGAPGETTEPRPDQEPSQRRPGTAGKSRGEGKEQRWPGPQGPQFRAEECVPASGHSRHLRAPPRGVGCLWSRVATPRWQDQLGDEGHAPRERKFQLSQDRAEARPPRPGRRRSTARPAAGWAPRRACKGSGATDPRAARSPPPRGGTSRLSP